MHRTASIPSEEPNENLTLVEQPQAPILFLTSAQSDISTLAFVLKENPDHRLCGLLRSLDITYLKHNALIDHYLSTTAAKSKIILVRFLGARSDWSYGFEQLENWRLKDNSRKLIVLSGTLEEEMQLCGLSNINYSTSIRLSRLLRKGGFANMKVLLDILNKLYINNPITVKDIKIKEIEDPYIWDWDNSKGTKIGVIFYSSILNSGDQEFPKVLIQCFRESGLNPRTIWVSSLKDSRVQEKVLNIFESEKVRAVITTTSFASINFENYTSGNQFWDLLNVPLFQILSSSKSKSKWLHSSRGISPLDLSLQVVLPELDGRITTKIGAFKSVQSKNTNLSSSIYKYKPEKGNIKWITKLIKGWLNLQNKSNNKKKLAIILANYPSRDARIGNGVGLDTPESAVRILNILQAEGYELGQDQLPSTSKDLIKLLLSGRTNSEESSFKEPLFRMKYEQYYEYWDQLDKSIRDKVLEVWPLPGSVDTFNAQYLPINGILLGNIAILIQPSRGLTEDNIYDIHSPTLPPSHNYLAFYHWLANIYKADAIIHLGKHGSAEWLPGKSVGLSNSCFPQVVIPPIPYLYPFIVNDPGEGSQAKRRTHAVIIDHLTPPLSRAGLTDDLVQIEVLLDEYYDSQLLDNKRSTIISEKIDKLIYQTNLQDIVFKDKETLESNGEDPYIQLDSYLCQLKEAQIRTGLHIYSELPSFEKLCELVLAIALTPSLEHNGIGQSIAKHLDLDIDPWIDNEGELITKSDLFKIKLISASNLTKKGDLISWINDQAFEIVRYHISRLLVNKDKKEAKKNLYNLAEFYNYEKAIPPIQRLCEEVIPPILTSSINERFSLIKALEGKRVKSGPSGAPTRGNINVLPTGKNFFSVDLRGVPTQSAWDLGKRSAEQILDLYQIENGSDLKHLAMSVWGTSTMRNGGEDISQLLFLIGVKPVWDHITNKLIDLEIIPLSILQRPRVDVTLRISGLFRDAFPNLIDLVSRAQSMISGLNEEVGYNPYSESIKDGNPAGRIFGSAPESYGTGLQELIDLGNWESKSELSDRYLQYSQWNYLDSERCTKDRDGLEFTLSKVQVVLHSQDNREHDLLDSDDYYQFHGALANAVKSLSGNDTSIYFADNSKYSRPLVHTLEKEIDKVVRSRLLNQKWIKGMKQHGYKGAFEMSASMDYMFAYDATTNAVPNWCYSKLLETWILDKDIIKFLKQNNPWALRDILERLLEANNRDLWNANESEIKALQNKLIDAEKDIEQSKY